MLLQQKKAHFGHTLLMSKLFLSHRLDLLAEHLAQELAKDGLGIFMPRIIVVPNSSLKSWILIQIANQTEEKGIAGCKVMTLEEALETLTAPSGHTEIFCSIFNELKSCKSEEIRESSPRRIIELANRLTGLFIRYGNYCPALFEEKTTNEWQEEIIQKLFVKGHLRLPVQMPPIFSTPIHCFGFDYLPSAIWKLFNFSSIYLFSPCCHFWEDLCTDRERIKLGRYWKQKGASDKKREELDIYLKNAPTLLANWGRPGRETLKILDSVVEEIEEDYRPPASERETTLARLRKRLLSFQFEEKNCHPRDASIQISKTGSSLLREIEHLRRSILQLVEEEGLLFSDIAVFAPDINAYASLIQLVFFDIPYKISGLDIGSKSFFYQGMHRLFELDLDSEDLSILFENPSFCRARGWSLDILEQIREWLKNPKFEIHALDQYVYLFPEEKKRISTSQGDALEQFIDIHQSLRSDLASLEQSRTLSDWSKLFHDLMQKYFSPDLSDEADAAAWSFFQKSMRDLKEADREGLVFPFAPIQSLLKRSISQGQIHASYLHAVRCGSLAEGTLTCAKALFLIGMDEERFPRRSSSSSLDLLRFEKMYPFESVDQDRYLFLQALFAASEFIHFSYSHLSSEGNPINPTSLIEELIRGLDAPIKENVAISEKADSAPSKTSFYWPDTPALEMPKGERIISLSDLSSLARHPWEFFLKKQFGIRFSSQEVESFSRQKARIRKANLQTPLQDLLTELPIGICGDALAIDLVESSKNWAGLMREWDVAAQPVSFRMSCREKRKTEHGWEFPALELEIAPGLHVKLVGALKTFTSKGFIHTGNDSLDGLLPAWPECLAALVAAGSSMIYCLKSGKIKTVDQSEAALKAYISYYFISEAAPSPLLVDWADPILRKGAAEWEKKITDKMSKKGVRFEDPVWDWVAARVDFPPAAIWFDRWGVLLRKTFSDLTAIYSGKRSNAAV
jgi:exonuclease V gamma subunit